MNQNRTWGCAIAALGLCAGTTLAQNFVRVERKIGTGPWVQLQAVLPNNTSTATPPFDTELQVNINQGGANFGSNNVFIRIYDNQTSVLDNIGRVTLTGTPPSDAGRVKISVTRPLFDQGNPPLPVSFPLDAQQQLVSSDLACEHFGGLSFTTFTDVNGVMLPSTNVALLKKSDLALGIRGDLVGSIDVGRIFTMQLPGVVNAQGELVSGGTVKGTQSWPSFQTAGDGVTLWVRAWAEDIFAPTAAFDN